MDASYLCKCLGKCDFKDITNKVKKLLLKTTLKQQKLTSNKVYLHLCVNQIKNKLKMVYHILKNILIHLQKNV